MKKENNSFVIKRKTLPLTPKSIKRIANIKLGEKNFLENNLSPLKNFSKLKVRKNANKNGLLSFQSQNRRESESIKNLKNIESNILSLPNKGFHLIRALSRNRSQILNNNEKELTENGTNQFSVKSFSKHNDINTKLVKKNLSCENIISPKRAKSPTSKDENRFNFIKKKLNNKVYKITTSYNNNLKDIKDSKKQEHLSLSDYQSKLLKFANDNFTEKNLWHLKKNFNDILCESKEVKKIRSKKFLRMVEQKEEKILHCIKKNQKILVDLFESHGIKMKLKELPALKLVSRPKDK